MAGGHYHKHRAPIGRRRKDMHHEYRRRVQFLLNTKRQNEQEIKWLADGKQHVGWFTWLMTANHRLAKEVSLRVVINAIDTAMLMISLHYRWHYTKSCSNNPFLFPDELRAEIETDCILFTKVHIIHWNYTNLTK